MLSHEEPVTSSGIGEPAADAISTVLAYQVCSHEPILGSLAEGITPASNQEDLFCEDE
jgi:hypothetical protein